MINKFSFLIRFLFAIALVMGISEVQSSPIKIIFCTPSRSPLFDKFFEELEKRAPGEFDIKGVYHGDPGYVPQGRELNAIGSNEIDGCLASPADLFVTFKSTPDEVFGGREAKELFLAACEIQMMPFAFDDYAHMRRSLDKILLPIIQPMMEKLGLFAMPFYHGTRVLEVTHDRPVTTPNDIGPGLRIPGGETWATVGLCLSSAELLVVPHGEVKSSIENGTKAIKAIDYALSSFKSLKLDSRFKKIVLTKHLVHFLSLTISQKKWDEMSPAQQAAFSAAAQEAIRWNDEQVLANERDALEYYLKPDSGLQVMWPNLTAFRERARQILLAESPSKAFRDLHRQVQALLREEAGPPAAVVGS